MKKLTWFILLLALIYQFPDSSLAFERKVDLGAWSQGKLDLLLKKASRFGEGGQKTAFISSHFLGMKYKAHTLIGGPEEDEVFVVNLEEVDCFTFLDYMETFRQSDAYGEFENNLINIRYKEGRVSYFDRNHFFSDWAENNAPFVDDVTLTVGGERVQKVLKTLNLKEDGSPFLYGIPLRKRELYYIPSDAIDEKLIEGLKSGDYVGIYSDREGLDVSHVGIVIKKGKSVFFRHASLTHKKVIDESFVKYMANKGGIIILRAR